MFERKSNCLQNIERIVVYDTQSNDSALYNFALKYKATEYKFLKEEIEELRSALKAPRIRKPKIHFINRLFYQGSKDLRIILTDDIQIQFDVVGEYSHLVEGIEHDSDIQNIEHPYDLVVCFNSISQIKEIIRDVVFDILMFYWLGGDEKYPSIKAKRELSALKVDFCREKGYIQAFEKCKYASLASYSKDKAGNFDYGAFIRLWDEFDEFLDARNTSYDRIQNVTNEVLTDRIIQSHSKGAQISRKRLLKLIENNSEKRFIIVRTEKKPRSKKKRDKILGLFGCVKWRTGIVELRRFEDQYLYEQHKPYVSVFIVER